MPHIRYTSNGRKHCIEIQDCLHVVYSAGVKNISVPYLHALQELIVWLRENELIAEGDFYRVLGHIRRMKEKLWKRKLNVKSRIRPLKLSPFKATPLSEVLLLNELKRRYQKAKLMADEQIPDYLVQQFLIKSEREFPIKHLHKLQEFPEWEYLYGRSNEDALQQRFFSGDIPVQSCERLHSTGTDGASP